jgi:hypothetical protein
MSYTELSQRIAELERSVAELGKYITGMPLRVAEERKPFPKIVLATVNGVSGVTPGGAFDVDNVIVLSGDFKDSEITSVQNNVGGIHDDNELVVLIWNEEEEQWELVNDGTIENTAGCGIDITNDEISVERTDLIGDGLTTDTGDCEIKVLQGDGLLVNASGVHVDPGCGISIEGGGTGFVTVFENDLVLPAAESGLDRKSVADQTCGIKVDNVEYATIECDKITSIDLIYDGSTGIKVQINYDRFKLKHNQFGVFFGYTVETTQNFNAILEGTACPPA